RSCKPTRRRCPGPSAARTTTSRLSPGSERRHHRYARSPLFHCAMRTRPSVCWPWAAQIPSVSTRIWERFTWNVSAHWRARRCCAIGDMDRPAAPDAVDARRALVEAYLAHLVQQRRLSPATERGYRRGLDALLSLAGDTPLDQLEPHHLRRMVAQLHGRGL